ncbi:AbrB/MazE/SpoVT family DNA-binding domain-containing protein [Morganella psychrotolerans]|uniref:AbrB/MazE/SpoVT family DNA-binding domain-containing protein n=1 Tax=Morganella psychrotolerans TaxID=368603 RepID=A0A1B8HIJ1_9GAMM|nr:AbrB/MazE/SpoVT family DNA-binding domain-containing protein [Morganella psychrotolerans]KAA8716703.1 AbrB/MazE/SpoVT family DNA-binding domain-containing protein [Morganella psychrotolerans]OBU07078.1 hypothetical protein AYY17_19485 [Morganella psychrotolerans]OBU08931.1 hypothetical protein AYY16_06890 [Morganella psychrotolerans]
MSIAIKKWGNSQGVIIPTSILKQLGIEAGHKLDMYVENGNLVLSPVKKKFVFTEDYLVKNMTEFNSHADELAQVSGTEIGE